MRIFKHFNTNSPILIFGLFWIVAITTCFPSFAKTTNWTNATGGAWTTSGNWDNGLPIAGDDIGLIPTSGNIWVLMVAGLVLAIVGNKFSLFKKPEK